MLKTVFTKVVTAMAVAAALEVALVDIQPTQAANLSFDAGKPIPLILDDDGSQDGLIALAYMLQNPKFSIEAITISHGVAYPQQFGDNMMRALARLGVTGIPVGVGSEVPLAGNNTFPELFRGDSLNFYSPFVPPLTETALETVDKRDAAQLIIDTIKQSPDPVTILSTGALTNIAEALRRDPSIVNNVAAVEIMGGAVFVDGNLGYHTDPVLANNEVAEFNIWLDPVATQEVFSSGLPVFLTPLDATNKIEFTREDQYAWEAVGTRESILAAELLDYSLTVVSNSETPNPIWDLVAAINLSEASFCNEVPLHLKVDTDSAPGETQGQTLAVNGLPPNVNVCLNPSFNNVSFNTREVFSHKDVPEPSTISATLAFGSLFALLKRKRASEKKG
jgi:purine nucleosidase/pyrimidine-specific ribonucleoside hydrolase